MFSTSSSDQKSHQISEKNKITDKDTQRKGEYGVSSCLIKESCMIHVPVGAVWEGFKSFQLEKMAPTIISSCKFLNGNPSQIGSTYQVEYKSGITATYMIVELSELKRTITVDMIDCFPKMSFSSMLTTIKFYKVTNDDTTYMCWEGLFSNDIDTEVMRRVKTDVINLFKDFKSGFEKSEKKF
jgi:hypothetical protein